MDETTKNGVWALLGAGLDCPAVARSLGMGVTSVRLIEATCGGVRPRPRMRSERVLSLEEREEISRGLAEGLSLTEIATGLGRAPSTVSRRGVPQRRPSELPGPPSRPASLGPGQTPEASQARDLPEVGPRGGGAFGGAFLAPPDLPLVG